MFIILRTFGLRFLEIVSGYLLNVTRFEILLMIIAKSNVVNLRLIS